MFYTLKISKNGCRNFILCKQPIKFKRIIKSFHNCYSYKLDSSISRARSKIYEYLTNNEFTYFVTLTINNNYNRFDYSSIRRKISSIIRTMRKKGYSNLNYILIPEKHKNGAYHFHGFFSSGFGEDFYINDNGFLSWLSYDYIGYSSISKIKNYEASCKYVLKYVNKDMCKAFKGDYLYFHSQGLKTNEHICTIVTSGLLPVNYTYENFYISKALLDYYNYITLIDFLISNNKIYNIS